MSKGEFEKVLERIPKYQVREARREEVEAEVKEEQEATEVWRRATEVRGCGGQEVGFGRRYSP